MYILDRNSFKAQSVEEAENHSAYYKKLSWQERLNVAIYLNSIAFRIVDKPEPRMNKAVFSAKARN